LIVVTEKPGCVLLWWRVTELPGDAVAPVQQDRRLDVGEHASAVEDSWGVRRVAAIGLGDEPSSGLGDLRAGDVLCDQGDRPEYSGTPVLLWSFALAVNSPRPVDVLIVHNTSLEAQLAVST
jgi:hypothetical protein